MKTKEEILSEHLSVESSLMLELTSNELKAILNAMQEYAKSLTPQMVDVEKEDIKYIKEFMRFVVSDLETDQRYHETIANYYMNIENILDKLLFQQPKEQKEVSDEEGWISTEKPPKVETFYLVYDKVNGAFCKALYQNGEWHHIDNILQYVTHWKPLPKPPTN